MMTSRNILSCVLSPMLCLLATSQGYAESPTAEAKASLAQTSRQTSDAVCTLPPFTHDGTLGDFLHRAETVAAGRVKPVWNDLEYAGVLGRDVSFSVTAAMPADKALQMLRIDVDDAIDFCHSDNLIRVASCELIACETQVYALSIDDVVVPDQLKNVDDLAHLIQFAVFDPRTPDHRGCEDQIATMGDHVVYTTTARKHQAIERLLERLHRYAAIGADADIRDYGSPSKQ